MSKGRLKNLVLNPKPKWMVRCGLMRLAISVTADDTSPSTVTQDDENENDDDVELQIQIEVNI